MHPNQYMALMGNHRILRAPEDDSGGGGGNTSGNGESVQGNNGTGTGTGQTQQDNTGDGFNADTFWDAPKDDKAEGQQQQQQQLKDDEPKTPNFKESIEKLDFDNVFDENTLKEIGEGKLDGANNAFKNMARESTKQAVIMSATIMQTVLPKLVEQQMSKIREEFKGTFTERDNNDAILKEFPSAKSPAMQKTVKDVFAQSMAHTKNDRPKAIAMTRSMLKAMGQAGAQDLGVPNANADDIMNQDGVNSLVESLMGRD